MNGLSNSKIYYLPSGQLDGNKVRAYFIAHGTTLTQWSIGKGYHPSTMKMALRGERTSDLSKEIIEALKKEIGIQ